MSAAPALDFDSDHLDESSPRFSLAEARRIVGDFFRPNPWIYWTDLLASYAVGMTAFALVLHPERLVDNRFWKAEALAASTGWHWPATIALFVVSALLIYRCSLFIHELVHIPANQFTAFRFVWNLLVGIPFLIPTFVYYTHIDHHRRKMYGTEHDGEYIPLANLPVGQLLYYLSQVLVIPILAIVRWGLLTPLTWISPRIRDWVHQHASSMVMDPKYLRPLPTKRTLRIIRLQELGCMAVIWFIVVRMVYAGGILFDERLSPWFVVQAYLTGVFIVGINALRTLGAHRWTNDGSQMNFVDQLLDSVNYPYHPITGGLWAPIGLRFHALHHVFPSMPYHALPEAHRRLMRDLPADSPYRRCEARSLPEALAELWRRAKRNSSPKPQAA
ncbi:MAG: fatty acid desaturase [Pirellulales bacterium]|nr:fatty acid desaturase [Pirellulales bacterium]